MLRKPQSPLFLIAFAGTFLAAGFLLGIQGSNYGQSDNLEASLFSAGANSNESLVDLAPFWKTWRIIDDKYPFDDKPDDTERLYGAMSGLVGSLNDPYSVFLPPREAEIFEEDIRGNFGGVGIEIGLRDDIITVIAPLEGSPAKRAGIRAGDRITAVDGEETFGFTVDEAVYLIRGEVGTPVTLTILRELPENGGSSFDTLEIEVVRGIITVPSIETHIRDSVFIIELSNFSGNATSAFRNALREFANSGLRLMILDLRGNPGGFLDAAIDIASWFLPLGKPVVIEDFGQNEGELVHRSKGYDVFTDDFRLVILIDEGSASASEILAGALSDHDIGTLVGTKSFGKGSVQELLSVTDDTYVKITVARWLTPDGTSISEGGLTPDHVIELTRTDIDSVFDRQLDEAITILKGQQ